jgi:outer membrane lipoprotein-sorting protein
MKRLFITLLFLAALPVRAEDGRTLLEKFDQIRNPLPSFAVDVQLTSYSGSAMETSSFRVYGKGSDRSVVEFTAPQSEKGKYLLMLRDAMWIYMPSASKPIRISPLQRMMGQASNGDVARTSFLVDYNPLGVIEEVWNGHHAWVLDLEAKDSSIAYAHVKLWIDQASYEPLRADFYVVSGKLIKREIFRELGQMAGRRAVTTVEIEDLLRPGNRTVMHYSNLTPRDNPDKMFSRDALGRW